MATSDVKLDEKVKLRVSEPKRFKVIFLNDDKTPIDFVIELLTTVFKHTQETAKEITLAVHNDGSAVVGVYSFEIAEQKTAEAISLSRAHNFPLQIKIDQD